MIRDRALNFAAFIEEKCPDSREKSLAITNLEQAVMWANAAIARNERPDLLWRRRRISASGPRPKVSRSATRGH
jgi:hypothetical protein